METWLVSGGNKMNLPEDKELTTYTKYPALYCPLIKTICMQERCAWWDEDHCAIKKLRFM